MFFCFNCPVKKRSTTQIKCTSKHLYKSRCFGNLEVWECPLCFNTVPPNLASSRRSRKLSLNSDYAILNKDLHQRVATDFASEQTARLPEQCPLDADETKVEIFRCKAQRHIWRKPDQALLHKLLMPTVKHGGARVMIWA